MAWKILIAVHNYGQLNLYSVKVRLLRRDIMKYWQILHGMTSLNLGHFFIGIPFSIRRGHQFKLAHVRTSLDIRKKFFNVRGISLWNSLPNSVVSLTNINSLKAALAEHLNEVQLEYTD